MKHIFKSLFLLSLLFSAAHASVQVDTVVRMVTSSLTYEPSSFTCHVGDTVSFKGSFATHPLVQDEVPSGADPINAGSSVAAYNYVVKAVGTYKFHCATHVSLGMKGQFVAEELGVDDRPKKVTFDLSQNYPNPVRSTTTIDYNLEVTSLVSLKVFSSDGKEIATLVNELQAPGHHTTPFDALHLAPGNYFYRLEIDGETITKQLVVTK
jgi:plastocyanin